MPRKNKKQPLAKKNMPRRIRLAVLPSKENDYQPHLIRRYGLVVILMVIIGVQLFYNFGSTGSVLGGDADVSVTALLDETNQARSQHDLPRLQIHQKLSRAAYYKTMDMFEKQYWGHNAPDGTEPWKWLVDAGYSYAKAGENLAKNFYTAEAVTAAWMRSPEHRANILDPDYTEVGFAVSTGVMEGKTTTIVVALYGRPAETDVIATVGSAVAGAQGESLSFLSRLGIGVQSITPAALGSIVMLTFLMLIAFMAHLYRDYIPAASNHPRHRRNHGAIKMSLMFVLILAMLLLYGGGQI